MVDVDVQDCLKSLIDYKEKLEKTLTARTFELIARWVQDIKGFTPVGDEVKFEQLYLKRQEVHKWKPEAGLLMGNWIITTDDSNTGFTQRYSKSGDSLNNDVYRAEASYKLGQTIILSNSTPYVNMVKRNGSFVDLKSPTLDSILSLYKIPFGDMLRG
jgi:hypothetical protein